MYLPPGSLLPTLEQKLCEDRKLLHPPDPPLHHQHVASSHLLMGGRNERTTRNENIYILVFMMPLVGCVTLGTALSIAGICFCSF